MWQAARERIEKTYDGVCDVINYGVVTDPVTHITSKQEITVYEALPCRISFRNNNMSMNNSRTSETAAQAIQKIKLFTSPDANIPKGSKIVVTQCGRRVAYKSSGEPMMYNTHQEIVMEIFDKWT